MERDSESLHIGVGSLFSNQVEICSSCGKSILKLLKDKKLTKVKNKKDEKK